MADDLLDWLTRNEGPLAYLVLAASAALEYVIPPLPGDTVTLFGTFLAATAGYSGVAVYLSLVVGSLAGGLLTYAFGRWLGRHEERWPSFLRGPKTKRAIMAAIARFDRHGAAYLTINRFLPALRSVFFVAAGMAGLPLWKVLVFGGVSASLWTALIFVAGWAVGHNWDALRELGETYTLASLAVVGAVVVVAFVVWTRRHRAR